MKETKPTRDPDLTVFREEFRYLRNLENLFIPLASTTTPLAANGEYVSPTFTVTNASRIVGSCYADQAGTLYVEQATPNEDWDVQSSFPYTAGEKMGFSVEVVSPLVRLRYVNGTTDQTVFRLYSYARRI